MEVVTDCFDRIRLGVRVWAGSQRLVDTAATLRPKMSPECLFNDSAAAVVTVSLQVYYGMALTAVCLQRLAECN